MLLIDIDYREIVDEDNRKRPELRLFGATQEGNTIAVYVRGFEPYLYAEPPAEMSAEEIGAFASVIERRIENPIRVEQVQRYPIFYYQTVETKQFLKITCSIPSDVAKVRKLVYELNMHPYECDIAFPLRYMIDKGIVGCGWVSIPDCPQRKRVEGLKRTRQQIEYVIDDPNVVVPLTEKSDLPPLRILSFDIECCGRPGIFPEAEHDPVIQIASSVTRMGEKKPFVRNVFVLDTCDGLPGGVAIHAFKSEESLLAAWAEFVRVVDPDIVTGYNVQNFDWVYLLDRAKVLRVPGFNRLSRVTGEDVYHRTERFTSKAYGTRDSEWTRMTGRVVLDVLQVVQRDYKLRSYTLNAVSQHFLGDQKEDVHHSMISVLHKGTSADRARLASYCWKDALLPQQLMDKLLVMFNYIEMARVTGVPLDYLLARGQQIKVISQLYREAAKDGILIPHTIVKANNDDVKYAGATVIEPVRGYYTDPITTLDFASLYPSIMMAHNLCYTTLIRPGTFLELPESEVTVTPTGHRFVKAKKKPGLLPRILDNLLSARKKAKADMKAAYAAGDIFRAGVFNGRQLALKISANSVYGFTGAVVGKLPCLEISASVTSFGREMIDATKAFVESHYTKANGYDHDAEVIYGDTDSVMIRFFEDLPRSMELGKEAATLTTKECFISPIKLEFEKSYLPYLLINKKRYAGMLYTNPDKPDKLDMKGVEGVRRDNCLHFKFTYNGVLNKLLRDRDPEGAVEMVKRAIAALYRGEVDMSQLILSKNFSKPASEYAAVQGHIVLVEKMRKRDPATAPQMGSRVQFVMVMAHKNARGYDKTENPLYALMNGLPIDADWYVDRFRKPFTAILEPILGNVKGVFSGEHTRRRVHPRLQADSKNPMMRYVTRRVVCVGCRVQIAPHRGKAALCESCEPRASELYQEQMRKTAALEARFARVWTNCQSCQGSFHQEVICSNNDCTMFYNRAKIKKDLGEATELLERFDI